MASGLEIFLIIFILLLVIAGICLAIYFVWRHDQKKRGPTSAPINGGGGGSTGTTGATGATGVTGAAYSQNGMVWSVTERDGVKLLELATSSSNTPCKNYLFNLESDGRLVWQGDGTSVVAGNLFSRGSVLVGPETLQGPSTTILWEYNETERTWCNKGSPTNLCIQSGQTLLQMNTVSGNNTFKWDRITSIPNSAVSC